MVDMNARGSYLAGLRQESEMSRLVRASKRAIYTPKGRGVSYYAQRGTLQHTARKNRVSTGGNICMRLGTRFSLRSVSWHPCPEGGIDELAGEDAVLQKLRIRADSLDLLLDRARVARQGVLLEEHLDLRGAA